MPAAIWQLQANHARLQLGPLSADLDLSRPALGLEHLRLARQTIADAMLLGVELRPESAGAAAEESRCEAYVREQDLVATYAQPPGHACAAQVYWRALARAESNLDTPVGIELVLSAQTSLLDARSHLVASSRLPATDTLRMIDAENGRFEPITARQGDALWVEPDTGAGCLLVRLAGGRYSYAEMVPPADVAQARLSVLTSGGRVLLRRDMLYQQLEKGVIVRARVRGWFVSRADDLAATVRCYREFAAAALPLTT